MNNIDPKQHSAEHILTAVFNYLFNGKIIDSRFKGTRVRCDYEILTNLPLEEIIAQTEERTNQIISENRDITIEELSCEEAKKKCSLHRLPDGVEKVRMVKIGSDVITPCKGQHIKNTNSIGTLRIRTYNFIKPGILRLTFSLE